MKFPEYSPALSGVRGVAALLVLTGHLGNRGLFLIPGAAHEAIGKPGVWLFFSLSAFLLTGRLTEDLETTADSRGALAAYGIRRVFRIFPLYLIAIFANWLLGDLTTTLAVRQVFLLAGWRELWAIPVEFAYYLVVPFIALFGARYGLRRAIQALAVALFLAFLVSLAFPYHVFWRPAFVHGKLVPFLAGSLGALLALERTPHAKGPWRAALLPGLSLAGFALTTAAYREVVIESTDHPSVVGWLSLALGVFGTAVMSLALEPNWLSRVLGSVPLAFLGRVSFSLYLWHYPIMAHARTLGLEFGPPIVRAWVYLAVCTLAAWVSYRLIERPGVELGRALGRGLRGWHSSRGPETIPG